MSVAYAAQGDGSKASAQVTYNEPEKFADFKTSESFRSADAEALSRQLTREIERSASYSLPPGYVLSIRFNNIDMAGDVNPFQRMELRDVREYRSVYPPRLQFDYSVTDATGTVVQSGSENLVDLAYDMKVRMPNSDTLQIESGLMRDFIQGLSRKLAKGQS